jgi:hypothetical protein
MTYKAFSRPDGIDFVGPLFTRSSGSKRFMLRMSVKIACK